MADVTSNVVINISLLGLDQGWHENKQILSRLYGLVIGRKRKDLKARPGSRTAYKRIERRWHKAGK